MRQILTLLIILTGLSAKAQQSISGKVTDKRGEAVIHANIYILPGSW